MESVVKQKFSDLREYADDTFCFIKDFKFFEKDMNKLIDEINKTANEDRDEQKLQGKNIRKLQEDVKSID